MMKNSPPKINAKVVPTDPETGNPLPVAGLEDLPESVAVPDLLALLELADVVEPWIGNGLLVPYGDGEGLTLGEAAACARVAVAF